MRKLPLLAMWSAIVLLMVLGVDAVIPRRGMYVSMQSSFSGFPWLTNILGNTTNENLLFAYCRQHGINALSLYDIDNGILSTMPTQLRSFNTRARQNNGIHWIESIASDVLSSWQDVATYQSQCASDDERFDGMVTEIEYWASGGTNVSQMLAPVRYMKTLNPVARRNPINASWSTFYYAAYIGWPQTGQILNDMDPVLDYLFIHAYVASPTTSFGYTQERVTELLQGKRMRAVTIFSAEGTQYNAGGNFMGDWFASNTTHNVALAEQLYETDYTAAFTTRYNQTEFGGFQYFTYAYLAAYSNYTSNSGPWTLGKGTTASPNVTSTWPLIRAGSAYTSIAWCPTYNGSSTLCQDVKYIKMEHDVVFVDMFDTPASTIAALKYRNWTNGTSTSSLPKRQIICYFSGGTWENWRPDVANFSSWTHPNQNGDWPGEDWFDVLNATVRAAIYPGMLWRLNYAKAKGCDAVQSDNMDCWTNSECALTAANTDAAGAQQIIYNTWMANAAHSVGLAIGLINDLLQITQLEPLYDFAIQESCMEYSECAYIEPFLASGKAVFHVEYNFNVSQVCANDLTVALGYLMSSLTAVNGLWQACPDAVIPPTRSLESAATTTSAPTTSQPPNTTKAPVTTTTTTPSTTTAANSTTTTSTSNVTTNVPAATTTTTTALPNTTSNTTTAASNTSATGAPTTTAAPSTTSNTTTAASNSTTTTGAPTTTNPVTTQLVDTNTTTTTVAPPPTPTSSAVPFLRSTLRIPGDGFAQIINSGNSSQIALLKFAVRRDLAKLLNILELYIIINSMSIGSLVTDFSVTSDANTTASAANMTLSTLPNSSSWLSSTQAVYSTYTTQGQSGAILAPPTVTVSSVGVTTDAPTTIAAIPTTTAAPSGSPTVTTSLGGGCSTACIAFAVAAAVLGVLVVVIVTALCCCSRGAKVIKENAAAPTAVEPTWDSPPPQQQVQWNNHRSTHQRSQRHQQQEHYY